MKVIYFALLLTLAFSQITPAQNSREKRWKLDNKGKEFSLSNITKKQPSDSDLAIHLNDHGAENIVILREGKDVSDSVIVKAWLIKYSDVPQPDVLAASIFNGVQDITSIADEDIIFENATLRINEKGSQKNKCLIEVTVPSGKKVDVYLDGDLKYSGSFTNNVLIRGAETTSNSPNTDRNKLLAELIVGPTAISTNARKLQLGVIISPQANSTTGAYVVSWETIKNQLKEPPAVISAPSLQQENCQMCSIALLKIRLDNQGNITKLERVGGSKEIAAIAIAGLYQWKFKPFWVRGRTVPVESLVPVKVENGRLLFESDSK
jgi:hypothetical protein